MLRRAREWALLVALGVVLGLGVTWFEDAFGIPRNVVQWFWILLVAGVLAFAAWAAWGYYGAVRDEDEPE